jgi:hypothetical protein
MSPLQSRREASGYISVVGARIGEQINHDYKAALAVDRLHCRAGLS